jgi:hypothetical protein
MGQDGRFEKWASGILGAVALMLALHLAWPLLSPHRSESRARIPAQHSTASRASLNKPSSQPSMAFARAARVKVRAPRKQERSSRAIANEIDRPSEKAAVIPSTPSAPSAPVETAQSLTAPPPAIREFETLGYVEKQDGTRQAVISKGDQVFVVHDGEVFDGHYRVLSISGSKVEAADLTVPQIAPGNAPDSTLAENRTSSPISVTKEEASRVAGAATSQPVTLASAKTLGYVDRPGRPRETIIDDGDEVRLVPTAVETDATLVTATSRPSIGEPSPAVARPPQPPASDPGQSPASTGEVAVTVQPSDAPGTTSTAEFSMTRGINGKAGEIPNLESAGEPAGDSLSSAPQRIVRDAAVRNSLQTVGGARASPSPSPPQLPKAFCYVERPKNGREAFVSLGDTVYSTRAGSTIANRYRVLRILPEGVEVADTRDEPRPPPNYEAAQNRLPDEDLKSGNDSPPVELPWDGHVRPEAFLWTNFAASEASPVAEPGLLAHNPIEPTLKVSRSSTSSVGLGPPLRSFDANPIPEFDPTEVQPIQGQGGSGLESLILAHPTEADAEGPARKPKPQEITQLPVRVSAELIRLPEPAGETRLAGKPPETGSANLASGGLGLTSPSTGLLGGIEQGAGISGALAQISSASHLMEISRISGCDLLLGFSIGDNGCYFP